jgi:hypothetical protein
LKMFDFLRSENDFFLSEWSIFQVNFPNSTWNIKLLMRVRHTKSKSNAVQSVQHRRSVPD